METVKIKINGREYDVPQGSTILEAAHSVGIDIPTLCYMKKINAIGSCRICVVEVKGAKSLVTACVYPVNEGMEVYTNSLKVQKARRMTLELILSNHKRECLTCVRNQNCELQTLSREYGLEEVRFSGDNDRYEIEDSTGVIVRDNNKCILCRRCVAACKFNQAVAVIGPNQRGFNTHIACAFEGDLAEVPCVSCGQCIASCPTGALTEKDDTDKVWAALADPTKHVVVGVAPSIRVHMGEFYGMPIGTNVEGKIAAALKRMGFDGVFDVDTAADLTIMEEGTEFLERLNNGGKLPLITSCSPGWIKFAEYYYPEFLENISSCKSPQGMFGAVMKSYYAEKMGLDPKDIYVVSIMPCTAKKFEINRDDQDAYGEQGIDVSITSREFARMIDRAGLRFADLPDEEFDPCFGVASGAGHIFGATGGVMEAALRTLAEVVDGKPLEKLDFHDVRGTEGIKEATYVLGGKEVNVCVASGLANCREVLESVKKGEKNYHFIEFMACPGGCVNGGGQPIQPSRVTNFLDLRAERAKGLYGEDAGMKLRKSHENPVIKELYDTYFEKPGSHKAHELLHTSYVARQKYSD
ncbi:NADH-dependent [FeFe] hydrogenase, group A6 [Feifania hominis]|uniref:Iron hydrogenase small subunit n=1 Tax=Feifania hominis TaxID=2763660 RepID=A0A926HQB3_9FIRM|nr:NADH-dependent [FeFe] hydrogenase, group A6 [Feifania hominis]MBC8536147.1 iron hydrogenase small subunit [Feifania hominis]